jgi:cell division protein FtsZ
MKKDMIKFDMPKNQSSIIKVIGVGGGGSNAVSHMYKQGIRGVDFMICNTDAQAMDLSPVPNKVQLGEKGLGAGSIPSVGKVAAESRLDEIREILEKDTQMVFITAGMGGGTGTGAAPVIASLAKELGILTVGIVTIPFSFEGRKRRQQAEEGINELRKEVDTLLIICNDKLRELYGDLKLSEAFQKADNVLTTASKGIAEIITVTGYINVDFEDVKTVMQNSGKAIMGSAEAEGENRAIEAIKTALSSPLLNDNDIEGASNVLLYITSGEEEISMDEVTEITDYIQREAKAQAEIIWGNGVDKTLGNKISITLIATGFDATKKKNAINEENRIRYHLNDTPPEQKEVVVQPKVKQEEVVDSGITLISKKREERTLRDLSNEESSEPVDMEKITLFRKPFQDEDSGIAEAPDEQTEPERTVTFEISDEDEVPEVEKVVEFDLSNEKPEEEPVPEDKKPFEVYIKKPVENRKAPADPEERQMLEEKTRERIEKLKNLSYKLRTEENIEEMENEPAYLRRKVELNHSTPSKDSKISRYSLYENDDKNVEVRSNNSFLHDNVD